MASLTPAEIRKINARREAARVGADPKRTVSAGERPQELPGWIGLLAAGVALGAIYMAARLLGFDLPSS